MVKSMTGFGRGCYEEENFSVTVEIKSVNHRYNETAIRLPHFLNPLEDKIRKTILTSVSSTAIQTTMLTTAPLAAETLRYNS